VKRKKGPSRRRRPLEETLARARPDLADSRAAIAEGRVVVDGRVVTNPSSLVGAGASIVVVPRRVLRGEVKLSRALETFDVDVVDRVALDVGAAAGGFTRALLTAGARRVYAVDAGHGQLLGSIRRDPRVVVRERTNLGDLDASLVPEPIEVITLDLSYLAIAEAVPQLEDVQIESAADLVALVKPMFELHAESLPTEPALLLEAVGRARASIERLPWSVSGWIESPTRGGRGSVEYLVHARRRT
jgi:23S rRNA (cytidine1920-2'-O)/16S rRNA (cytidine1409-2'-O)-methyltransferase